MRGRKPVPTGIRTLLGNPGRRPLPANEPVASTADVYPAPEWLEAEAREEWERLEPELRAMRILTKADLSSFAAYCAEWGLWRQAQQLLKGKAGRTPSQKTRLLGWRRQAAIELRKWASEFGLTPSSRTRIHAAPVDKAKDPLAKYLAKPRIVKDA